MNATGSRPSLFRRFRPLATIACAALALPLIGCPAVPTDDPNGNQNTNTNGSTTVTARIVNFSANISVPIDLPSPLSVLYTVTGTPTTLSGFYVPVADDTLGSGPIGDRVITAMNLPVGVNQAFSFDPAAVGVGFFRVGVLAVTGADEVIAESDGVIQVTGPPQPMFVQPAALTCGDGANVGATCGPNDATTCAGTCVGGDQAGSLCSRNEDCVVDGVCVGSGPCMIELSVADTVNVSFDVGDPEGNVQWRLFYLRPGDPRDAAADLIGVEIAVGSGNVAVVPFAPVDENDAPLPDGDYELGLSTTDSGRSVVDTALLGQADGIVTIFGPFVRVIS